MGHHPRSGVHLQVVPGSVADMNMWENDTQLSEFAAWLTSWNASPDTIRHRCTAVAAALRVWGDPATVTREDLEGWLSQPHLSAWTRATYFSHAASFFGWLASSGRIAVDPMIGMRRPTQPKGKPRPLSPDEEVRALSTASGDVRTYILLAMLAGLRSHEIAKVRGEHVERDALYVRGKGGKDAVLPTHPDLWELAQDYPRVGFWFPSKRTASGHLNSARVTELVTAHFRAVGIPEGSIHRCRHSYGTNLLRGGANIRVVQELMRHESLTSTQVYTAVDEDERAAAVRLLRGAAA